MIKTRTNQNHSFIYRNVSRLQTEDEIVEGVSGDFTSNIGSHLDHGNSSGNSSNLRDDQSGLKLSANTTFTRMDRNNCPAIVEITRSLAKSADIPQAHNLQFTTNDIHNYFAGISENMVEPLVGNQSTQLPSSKPIIGWEYNFPQTSAEEIERALSPMSSFLFIPSLAESEQSSSSKPTLARKASQNMKDRIKQMMQYDRK